jgi:hypothetical protein
MCSPSNTADDLHRHLATFSRSVEHEPAWWLSIVSNGSSHYDCLSKLLGLHYEKIYLPLMLYCGFIIETKSNKYKTITMAPSIESKLYGGYTWTDFIHEYRLNIEISYIIEAPSKMRLYFICVGSFEKAGSPFTIWDQVWASIKFKYHTLRDGQKELIAAVGKDSPVLLSNPNNVQIKKNNTT